MKAPDPTEPAKSGSEYRRKHGPTITLGYTLAAGMIFFTLVGYYFDHRFGTDGRWTLCGMFLGLIYGGYEVWKVVRRIQSGDQPENSEP